MRHAVVRNFESAVYAFAYDDYPMAANQAGFYSCTGGTQLSVTFCPAG